MRWIALGLLLTLAGCASDKPELGAREIAALQGFSTDVVYTTPEAQVGLPSVQSTNPDYSYVGSQGALGAALAELLREHKGPAYQTLQSALDDGLKHAGDLRFTDTMLADSQAVVSRSPWLGKTKPILLSAKDSEDPTATELTGLTTGDVVVLLDRWVEIAPDASGLYEFTNMVIYTRDQHHELVEYRRHLFIAQSDSPIKPVSVYQKDIGEWTKLTPVPVKDYMQNWFGDDASNLKHAFGADSREMDSDLDAYINGVQGS